MRHDTSSTMSACLEVLGMTLPYSASIPALYPGRLKPLGEMAP
jgi:dihydroxyacid dehydratase/phosphogluconate dehydratase